MGSHTEKYVFLISAAVASGFTPKTWYGSLDVAASRDVACSRRYRFEPRYVKYDMFKGNTLSLGRSICGLWQEDTQSWFRRHRDRKIDTERVRAWLGREQE